MASLRSIRTFKKDSCRALEYGSWWFYTGCRSRISRKMKFAHPLFLLLSLGPIVWCVYSFLRSSRPLGAMLKALSMAAILLALGEPSLTLPETKAAKVVLVDTSASISKQELARASSIAQAAEASKGRNWIK